MKNYTRVRVRLRRPCTKCEEMFIPTGRTNRLCKDCFKQIQTTRRQPNEK